MRSAQNLKGRRTYAAFTLIELMVVILVIGILASLLLGAIRGVRRHAHRVAAAREVSEVEQAWRAYYSHYSRWPSFATEATDVGVTGEVANVLQGDNRDQIPFIEFSRFDANGDPVSPWGYADRVSSSAYFLVRFDTDYNNSITTVDGAVRRPVVVWTVNGDDGSIIGSWQ